MKTSTLLLVLGAMFVTATLVTAFALTLFSVTDSANFFARFWRNAWRFGWVCGLAVVVIFWLIQRAK